MALGKADLATARLYSSLVEDTKLRERVFDLLEAEFHRSVRAVLAITRQKELLETNQVLAHSIKLRNPYVDPMHLIQVDMLRRKRGRRKHAGSESRHCSDHQRHCRGACATPAESLANSNNDLLNIRLPDRADRV